MNAMIPDSAIPAPSRHEALDELVRLETLQADAMAAHEAKSHEALTSLVDQGILPKEVHKLSATEKSELARLIFHAPANEYNTASLAGKVGRTNVGQAILAVGSDEHIAGHAEELNELLHAHQSCARDFELKALDFLGAHQETTSLHTTLAKHRNALSGQPLPHTAKLSRPSFIQRLEGMLNSTPHAFDAPPMNVAAIDGMIAHSLPNHTIVADLPLAKLPASIAVPRVKQPSVDALMKEQRFAAVKAKRANRLAKLAAQSQEEEPLLLTEKVPAVSETADHLKAPAEDHFAWHDASPADVESIAPSFAKAESAAQEPLVLSLERKPQKAALGIFQKAKEGIDASLAWIRKPRFGKARELAEATAAAERRVLKASNEIAKSSGASASPLALGVGALAIGGAGWAAYAVARAKEQENDSSKLKVNRR